MNNNTNSLLPPLSVMVKGGSFVEKNKSNPISTPELVSIHKLSSNIQDRSPKSTLLFEDIDKSDQRMKVSHTPKHKSRMNFDKIDSPEDNNVSPFDLSSQQMKAYEEMRLPNKFSPQLNASSEPKISVMKISQNQIDPPIEQETGSNTQADVAVLEGHAAKTVNKTIDNSQPVVRRESMRTKQPNYASTIPEENESMMSPDQTNPKNKLLEHSLMISDNVTPSKRVNDRDDTSQMMEKQPELSFEKKNNNSNSPVPQLVNFSDKSVPYKEIDVDVPVAPPNTDFINEEISDTERPPENTPDNKADNITPRIENENSLHYFESKDPDPKQVKPLSGSGPALTKTLVKPQLVAPIPLSASAQENKSENTSDKPNSDQDAEEELRKIEEEVAQLQKQMAADPTIGLETEEFADQSYMVDGKRKRKKKKKKKRTIAGGVEMTVAEVTIDDVSLDEVNDKDLILNPVAKKKSRKHKKKPNTKLNTVQEDSKEQSMIKDALNMDTMGSRRLSEASKSNNNINTYVSSNSVSQNSTDDNGKFFNRGNEGKKPSKKESTFKLAATHDVQRDISQDLDQQKINESIQNDKTISEVSDEKSQKEPPILKQNVQNKRIFDLSDDGHSPVIHPRKIMYLENKQNTEEDESSPAIFEKMVSEPTVAIISSPKVQSYKEESSEAVKKNYMENQINNKRQLPPIKTFDDFKKPVKAGNSAINDINMKKIQTIVSKPKGIGRMVQMLPVNCEIHQDKTIKYYCREDECKFAICQE